MICAVRKSRTLTCKTIFYLKAATNELAHAFKNMKAETLLHSDFCRLYVLFFVVQYDIQPTENTMQFRKLLRCLEYDMKRGACNRVL